MEFFTGQRMLVGLGLLALAAALAAAGEPIARELQAAAAAVNQESRDPAGPSHVVTALAALFDLSAGTIESERAATRLGFGEIAIALAIVEATGGARNFQQVVAMKQSGLGWGQVVHALRNEGVIEEGHLGPIVSQVRRTAQVAGALREAAATAKGGERPATVSPEARGAKDKGESHGSPGGPPAGVGLGQGGEGGSGRGNGRGAR